jgi:hypothetical protein
MVWFHCDLSRPLLIEKYSRFERARLKRRKAIADFGKRFPGVENIIDQQNIATLNIESLEFFDVQVTGGYTTPVGRSANQANPQWHIKTTDQIRKHHDRAGHNRHNRDWVLSVLAAKGRAKLLDPLSDRLLIEKYFHERMR